MLDIQAIKKQRFDTLWDRINATEDMYPEESKLRIEQPLLAGKGQYIFDIKNAVVDGVVEHHLDRNDVFVPNAWSVLIGIKDKNTGVETLHSYIPFNDGVNPSAHAVGFTNDDIKSLYSGFMAWNLDNKVVLSAYPMEKFQKVPRTQPCFVLDSNDAAVNEGIQSEWTLDKALELIMPMYVIAGTRDHKISVNFPAAGLTFPLNDADYEARLVLLMDGFLVKGGCEYKGGSGRNPFGQAVGQW